MSGLSFSTVSSVIWIFSVDAQRIVDSVPFSFFLIIGPIELVICLGLLYRLLGLAVLVYSSFSPASSCIIIISGRTWNPYPCDSPESMGEQVREAIKKKTLNLQS